jgi:hypothetical protein
MKSTRRKFITTSTLAVVSLSVSNIIVGKSLLKPIVFTNNPLLTITQQLRNASLKRKAGLFLDARNIYNQIILISPSEIRAYDGIRKLLLFQKFKELEVLQLYENGLLQNPNSAIFKSRIAKEYRNLSLGNKKFETQLNLTEDLLIKSKNLFEEIKIENPEDFHAIIQYDNVAEKINFSASSTDARTNNQIKAKKKIHHHEHKIRFEVDSEQEIKIKLDKLLDKTSNDFRDIHVRETYRAYIKKLKLNQKFDQAAIITKELFLFDKNDTQSLKIARNVCNKDKKYDVLESIERKNDTIKKSFWSKNALLNVLIKRYSKEGVGSLSEMQSILNTTNNKKRTFYQKFEYRTSEIKLSILKNNNTITMNLLNVFADNLIGISSAHFIDKFNMLCVKYYKKINDKKTAMTVLGIALKEKNTKISDPFLKKLIDININKETEKPIHNQRLINYRIKLMNL